MPKRGIPAEENMFLPCSIATFSSSDIERMMFVIESSHCMRVACEMIAFFTRLPAQEERKKRKVNSEK